MEKKTFLSIKFFDGAKLLKFSITVIAPTVILTLIVPMVTVIAIITTKTLAVIRKMTAVLSVPARAFQPFIVMGNLRQTLTLRPPLTAGFQAGMSLTRRTSSRSISGEAEKSMRGSTARP